MLLLVYPSTIKGSRQSIAIYDNQLEKIGSDPRVRLLAMDRQAKPDLIGYIRHCGLRIESKLSEVDFRSDTVTICWYPDHLRTISFDHKTDLRGDELIFHHLNVTQPIGWVTGHPRSILKWAATLTDCHTLDDYWPSKTRISMFDTGILVWWAQRINLKVYASR